MATNDALEENVNNWDIWELFLQFRVRRRHGLLLVVKLSNSEFK